MRMTNAMRSILLGATMAEMFTNGQRQYEEPVKIGNRGLPKHIQDQLIAAAKAKREARANRRYHNGLKRDSGYYRANYESNKNRFVFLKNLEV